MIHSQPLLLCRWVSGCCTARGAWWLPSEREGWRSIPCLTMRMMTWTTGRPRPRRRFQAAVRSNCTYLWVKGILSPACYVVFVLVTICVFLFTAVSIHNRRKWRSGSYFGLTCMRPLTTHVKIGAYGAMVMHWSCMHEVHDRCLSTHAPLYP